MVRGDRERFNLSGDGSGVTEFGILTVGFDGLIKRSLGREAEIRPLREVRTVVPVMILRGSQEKGSFC